MVQAAPQEEAKIQWQTITHKIVLLGATAVGKTSIFNRIQQNEYIEENVTTMAAYWRPKTIEVPESKCKVKIQLWDTAGQERFQSLTRQYTQGASGVVLVYDLTEADSLKEVLDWYNVVKQQNDTSQMVMALVGNKADDVDRVDVSRKDAQATGQEVGANILMEVSAKSGQNVDKMFMEIAKELIKKDGSVNQRSQSMMLQPQQKKKKGGCCGGKKDKK